MCVKLYGVEEVVASYCEQLHVSATQNLRSPHEQ
jgi:hypothetical protein